MSEETRQSVANIEEDEKEILKQEINSFVKWLIEKKVITETFYVKHVINFPYANEDSTMTVDTVRQQVSFNTFIRNRCTPEYYKIVVLHEFFHLAVQKVPNKDDATKIKDDFGAELMKLIDIEADFYVALYLKEKLNYTLVKYWVINYEGGTVFSDRWVRAIKFERFIGSLLSISKMFINYPDDGTLFSAFDLYLPTISPIYTEDSLHVLVIRKEHIYFDEIKASYQDFADLKRCYQDVTKFSIPGYVKDLIKFSCKALNTPLPKNIEEEINNLNTLNYGRN